MVVSCDNTGGKNPGVLLQVCVVFTLFFSSKDKLLEQIKISVTLPHQLAAGL